MIWAFETMPPRLRRPLRVTLIGGIGSMVYVLLGQVKAFNLGIPFDGFSVVGLVAYWILLVGLVWHLREKNSSRKER